MRHGQAKSPMSAAAARSDGLRRWASYASLALALVMLFVKGAAWLLTGSVALLASAVDAAVDLAASAATVIAVHYARRPADREHRYGHGKAEAVSALLQAVFLAGAAVTLLGEAVQRFLVPHPVAALDAGLAVIAVSLCATLALVAFQTYVVKRTDSQAIGADFIHYSTDVLINVMALAALGLIRLTGWQQFDPIFAIAMACYLLFSGWRIARTAFAVVLDRELPEPERRRIERTILAEPLVKGLHDLRTRSAGDRIFVEFHLELDHGLTVAQGHTVADRVERAVRGLFPSAEVLAHQEPAGIVDERIDQRIAPESRRDGS